MKSQTRSGCFIQSLTNSRLVRKTVRNGGICISVQSFPASVDRKRQRFVPASQSGLSDGCGGRAPSSMSAHAFILPETLYFSPQLLPHIHPHLCCRVCVMRPAGSSPPVCHPDSCFFVTQILISAVGFLLSSPQFLQTVNTTLLCNFKVKVNDA